MRLLPQCYLMQLESARKRHVQGCYPEHTLNNADS